MAGRARNNKGPAPLIRADPFLDLSGSQNDGRCLSPGCWEKTGAHPQQYEPVFHDLIGHLSIISTAGGISYRRESPFQLS